MNPITIPTDKLTELNELIDFFLTRMNHKFDESGANLHLELKERTSMLGNIPRLMELATLIHGWAMGEASEQAMLSPEVLKAKQDIQRKWFQGKLAEAEALYAKCEQISKRFVDGNEALRSLLSYEKSLMNTGN